MTLAADVYVFMAAGETNDYESWRLGAYLWEASLHTYPSLNSLSLTLHIENVSWKTNFNHKGYAECESAAQEHRPYP